MKIPDSSDPASQSKEKRWILNTSNQGKKREFERLFAQYEISLEAQQHDLHEIDADLLTVVVHKASQLGDGILVEDTSLEIEGASVGVNVRWLLEHLSQYVGRKAEWRTLLAYQKSGLIYVFEGKIRGTIVSPRGKEGFGFDPFFLPDNSTLTLAEAKPDDFNARAKAVEALVHGRIFSSLPPITHWDGPWQEHGMMPKSNDPD
jgi:inosine/xanthosine triphosphate pyrophosphatase family protein